MTGEKIEDPNIDVGDIDDALRYELVITRHIEMILEDGQFDARAKKEPCQTDLRIPMLRGSVDRLFHSPKRLVFTK